MLANLQFKLRSARVSALPGTTVTMVESPLILVFAPV